MIKKKVIIVLLFLLFFYKPSNSAQLITNGQLSFYYDKEKNEVINVKGNQLGIVDISRLNIGIIEGDRFYLLKDFYKDIKYDLEKSKIEISGIFYGENFILTIEILDKVLEEIEFKIAFEGNSKTDMKTKSELDKEKIRKIVYQIDFENEYEGLKRTLEKNSSKKINFSDKNMTGAFYLSRDRELLDNIYNFVRIDNGELDLKMRNLYPFYITDVQDGRSCFVINFRDPSEKIGVLKGETRDSLLLTNDFENNSEIRVRQLQHLDILLSRGIIIDKITQNRANISYEIELEMRKEAYEEGIMPANQIIPKEEATDFEKLYLDYLIYEVVEKNIEFSNYKVILKEKTEKYIDSNFKRIYDASVTKEVYYLIKIIELVSKDDNKKYANQLEQLKALINTELLLDNKLKNNKNSRIGSLKNLEYLDVIEPLKLKEIVLEEYTEKYDKIYELLMPEKDNVDVEYNLEMIKLLKVIGERKKADMLLAKIEYIIKKNNYYIPKYYKFNGNNNQEIYGNLISDYLAVVE